MPALNLFSAIFKENSLSKIAVVCDRKSLTYDDLRTETLRIAAGLESLEIASGDRVALLLNDSPEFIASFVAIASSGAIAVPINMGLRLDEQQLILDDCGANVALVESDLSDALLANSQKLTKLQEVIVVSRGENQPITNRKSLSSYETRPLIQTLADLISETDGRPTTEFPPAGNETPAFILYTSGSTGEPKGAVHSQAHIFYTNDTFCREVLNLKPNDRLFSSSRLPFAYGLGNSLSFPLLNGATTILCRQKPSAEVISRIFVDHKPTIFFGVPVIYNLLLEYHRRLPLDCSSLRICVSAGEALPAKLGEDWEKTFGVPVLDGIGSTEMLHMFMSNHEGEVRYGSSGKLIGGYDARLLDEHANPTPPGAEGNLWVKGESAALGYWRKPEVTARTFVAGWVRTGDLYRSEDGYWIHMGRSDDCFKSSGQWVSPVEVEGALLRYERVSRVAVVEDFDKDGLPCACAFVICKDVESNLKSIEEDLREFLKASLPRFKQPRRYIFVSELPYTATGKIQRFKLRERLRSSESNLPFAVSQQNKAAH